MCFRYSTQAKMVDTGTGTLYIIGSFKRMTTDPDFKVWIYIIKFIKCIFLKSKFKFQLFPFLIKVIYQTKVWHFLICYKIIRLLYPVIAINEMRNKLPEFPIVIPKFDNMLHQLAHVVNKLVACRAW